MAAATVGRQLETELRPREWAEGLYAAALLSPHLTAQMCGCYQLGFHFLLDSGAICTFLEIRALSGVDKNGV
jgi:hypothetical protein